MKKIIASLSLLALLGTAAPGSSEDGAPLLTLEKAIALAQAQDGNRKLSAAGARLEAAEAALAEARSERRARVELQGGVQHTDNPVLVFSQLLMQENFQARNFELDELNRPDPMSDWSLRLSLEQPLWTGGRLKHHEAAARHEKNATAADRERVRQQVVREVTESYATALLSSHRLEVAREALEMAAAHVRLIDDLWRGGLVVESDLLLARVRESELREVVIRAESGVEVSRAALNLVLGRDLSTPYSLPETLLPESAEDETNPNAVLSSRVERAHEERPDLEAARLRLDAAGSQVDAARAGRRPQVGLQANYETHAEGFFGNDGDNFAVGLGFRLPLFEGRRTRSQVERARARQQEAEEMTELLEQSIELELRRAGHELRAAHQRLDEASRGAELAARSLTIVEDRYKEGLTTLPDLLEAETALTEARLRQVAAELDIILARASLDLATGRL